MKCVFCDQPEIKARAIVTNEFAFAFSTYIPVVPGHILIAPLRCVAKFEDLIDDERNSIFSLRERLSGALLKVFDAEGFNYAWNEGEIAGQSVPHFHFHMLPRKAGDTGITEYEPRKLLYWREGRTPSPEVELQQVADAIRVHL